MVSSPFRLFYRHLPSKTTSFTLVKLLFLLALLATLTSSLTANPPPNYYSTTKGLRGQELAQALHNLIDDHIALEYRETRKAISHLHQDPKKPENLIQIYTQHSVPKNDNQTWNREHLWPRSRGNSDKRGPDDTDLHHLFPSDYRVNAKRASLPFDLTSPPRLPTKWSIDNDSFQPPNNAIGDIARALFYMAIRYDGSDHSTSDLTLVSNDIDGAEMGSLHTLLQWHRQDPPDSFEKRRNELIFKKYQKNRNPFIDHPEFAALIWHSKKQSQSFPSPPQKR